ncbi:hypothetical protein DFP73DRAFT_167299 [Morchella snyderi]|nr:hypothetical protein DFP73DRAFT_167299 [Morchella snyderi]
MDTSLRGVDICLPRKHTVLGGVLAGWRTKAYSLFILTTCHSPSTPHTSELIHRNNLSRPLLWIPAPITQHLAHHRPHPHPHPHPSTSTHPHTHSDLVPQSPNPGLYVRPARGPAVLQKQHPWRSKPYHVSQPGSCILIPLPVDLVIRRVRESLFCWICTLMRDGCGCRANILNLGDKTSGLDIRFELVLRLLASYMLLVQRKREKLDCFN